MFSNIVVLPIHVFQIIYTCLLLSSSLIQNLIFSHLKFVYQSNVNLSGSISHCVGKLSGGSSSLDFIHCIFGTSTLILGRCHMVDSSSIFNINDLSIFLFLKIFSEEGRFLFIFLILNELNLGILN